MSIDKVMDIVKDIYGPNMRFFIRSTYRKPESEWIYLAYEFPS